jgi:mannose-6-phosphate isomerase-like protein (cupin superfamily)
VLLVVIEGSGEIWLDGTRHALETSQAVLVEKGRRQRLIAGGAGIRYLSIHVRRPPLQIAPLGG